MFYDLYERGQGRNPVCTDGHHGRKAMRRFHSRRCVSRSLRICGRFLFPREALDSGLAGVAVKASKRAGECNVTQLGRWRPDNIVLVIERGCRCVSRYRLRVSNVCGQEETDQAAGDPALTSPGRASISELRRKLSHDTSPSVPGNTIDVASLSSLDPLSYLCVAAGW